MNMTKQIFLLLMVLSSCIVADNGANGKAIFAKCQEIVRGKKDSSEAIKKIEQYLITQNREDFLDFIRETQNDPDYMGEAENAVVSMVIFARYYLQGPGKDEPLEKTLKQLLEPSLPSTWKWGLFDALRIERRELTENEVEIVAAILREAALNKKEPLWLRSCYLDDLGNLFLCRREILLQKSPDLEVALKRLDKAALPKRDDPRVREAEKLISLIYDYKKTVQKILKEEEADERETHRLQRHLSDFEIHPDFRLDVNDIDLPVFFQEQSLSEEKKKTILQDYRQILTGLEAQKAYYSIIQVYGQGDNAIRATKKLKYSASYIKIPDGFEDEFGIVFTSKNGQEQILIPQKLSDAYKDAIRLKLTYQASYDAFPDFIQLMNHLTAEKLPPVRDILYLHGEAQKLADEAVDKTPQDFIEGYGRHRYAPGSLLELTEKDGRLMASMYVMDKGSGKRVGEMPIIYDAGRWKIYVTKGE